MSLNPGEKAALRQVFPDRPESACRHCGGYHLRACPRIKKQEFLGNGNETSTEYWPRAEWEDVDYIIWPEDVFEEDE